VERTLHLPRGDERVFASKENRGRRPYWGQAILRRYLRPAVRALGIEKRIGWDTFRHSYSSLLRSVGMDLKVMQELLRHSSFRSTLDVCTQAITPAKHAVQAAVLSLVFSSTRSEASISDVAESKDTKGCRFVSFCTLDGFNENARKGFMSDLCRDSRSWVPDSTTEFAGPRFLQVSAGGRRRSKIAPP